MDGFGAGVQQGMVLFLLLGNLVVVASSYAFWLVLRRAIVSRQLAGKSISAGLVMGVAGLNLSACWVVWSVAAGTWAFTRTQQTSLLVMITLALCAALLQFWPHVSGVEWLLAVRGRGATATTDEGRPVRNVRRLVSLALVSLSLWGVLYFAWASQA